MVFIDDLGYNLFSLGIAGLLILYLMGSVFCAFRRGKRDFSEIMAGASLPLMLVGLYMVISGAFGQFLWPIAVSGPNSGYNILFYDPLVSFGLAIMAFWFAIRFKTKYEYVGFFGLLIGIMTFFYGVQGYLLNMTKSPPALLALYVFFGVAGIFSYPVALIFDRLPGIKKKLPMGWYVYLAIFFLAILLASLAAGYLAVSAIPAHLANPP